MCDQLRLLSTKLGWYSYAEDKVGDIGNLKQFTETMP